MSDTFIHQMSDEGSKEMSENELRTKSDSMPGYTFQNDFLALSRAFSLPEIDYTDISQREHLAAALKRWPLLAEFAEQK
jgi:hypothetical protein